MDEELLTSAEAARYLGVSRARVTQLAQEGRLGRQVAGRYNVFTRAELDQYKASRNPLGGRPTKARSEEIEKSEPALSVVG